MSNIFDNTNLDIIRKALDVEQKYKYVDIRGKSGTFSTFIIRELNKIYKLSSKNPKWLSLIELFEHYPMENFLQRKRIIKRLVLQIKAEINSLNSEANETDNSNENIYNTNVMYIKSVGAKVAYLMNKLDIYSVFDLISYFPTKYIDYSSRCLICELKEGCNATIYGKITAVRSFTTKNKLTVINVTITDSSASMNLNFFYAKVNKYMQNMYQNQFPKGSAIIVSGCAKIDKYLGYMTIDKPQYQLVNEEYFETNNLNLARIVPVYPLIDNLSIKTLRKAIFNALEKYENNIKNLVPTEIREKYNILERKIAIRQIHFPDSQESLEKARFSLVFEELFLLQLKLFVIREKTSNNIKTIPISIKQDGLVQKFINNLPFKLTNAQIRAINEILNDINSEKPMQRLLQGDVGSGKTIVACIMLLAAVENNYQAAIMAPTEILAQQHFNNFVSWLTPLGISVGLFTSSNGKKLRNNLERDLRNGQLNIAVGTHSLIQDNIEFNNLGAIVIDEQHRFGVNQRNKLKGKAVSPQTLTMTATPIPRTLALTVHGDLDLTVIDELPKGRKSIKTVHITQNKIKSAYDLIRNQVEEGHQAYIVFPLIEESETLSAKAATKEAEILQNGEFKDLRIGLLHGKMKNDEKDTVMNDFKNKKYDILVSTTVVEVGVDIPNATVIVIENAERFGLSQLHQLRGRVGRSDLQSYCILVSSTANVETKNRLDILTQTNDGFVIAEKDLEIRGPGEFLGIRQSGLPELHLADLTKDLYILELARKVAEEYVQAHSKEEFSDELKKYIKYHFVKTDDITLLD